MISKNEEILFRRYLSGASIVFEWGCGKTTEIAARYCASDKNSVKEVHSVDSHNFWIEELKSKKVKAKFYYVDINAKKKLGHPKDKSKIKNWPAYSGKILELSTPPDLVLVDGRFRVACALKLVSVLPKHGFLLVHDWNRKAYHVITAFYDIVEVCGRFCVLKKKGAIDQERLKAMIKRYELVPG